MIFITLGSQKFQFNRLLQEFDRLVSEGIITEDVFAQTGYSDYEPKSYAFENFLDRDRFSEIIEKATIVVTHGGTGAIVGAVKKGKKVIAVPRRLKYGEHVDDHQLQIVNQFKEMNLICACDDCNQLAECIINIGSVSFNKYESNTETIINSIDTFINS